MSEPSKTSLDGAIKFVTDLYADGNVVFLGDSNHANPAFKTFLTRSMKGMKEAGVTDLFLEIPREFQEHADAFFDAPSGSKAESMALASFATARGMGAEQTALIYEAKKQGIRTHFMDLGLNDAETKAYDTVVKLQSDPKHRVDGRFSYGLLSQSDKKLYEPAFETLFAQREKVNEDWAEKVAEVQKIRPNGKFIVMGGSTHADRKFIAGKTEKDVNELLESYVGKTSYVRLEASLDESIRWLAGDDIPKPGSDTIETPLAILRLPGDAALRRMTRGDAAAAESAGHKAGASPEGKDEKAKLDVEQASAPPERGIGDAVSGNLGMGLGGIIGALTGWFVGGPVGVAIGASLLGGAAALAVDGDKGLLGGLVGRPEDQNNRADMISAATGSDTTRSVEATTGISDMKRAVKQAKDAMAEIEQGDSTPSEPGRRNAAPARVAKDARAFR